MNRRHCLQQLLKSYLSPSRSDLGLWRSLDHLVKEVLIAQKSLIDRFVVALVAAQASPLVN